MDSTVCVAGKEEEGFNPTLPLIFPHGQCMQLSLEGLGSVVFLTSAVFYHPLPGKCTRVRGCCWTTQQTGREMQSISLRLPAVDCRDLSHPMHFFFSVHCCLETDSCISLVQRGKFLAATPTLAIWSTGQHSLASFQSQDLSDARIFH